MIYSIAWFLCKENHSLPSLFVSIVREQVWSVGKHALIVTSSEQIHFLLMPHTYDKQIRYRLSYL
jgi:hypothetical protein